MDRSMLPLIEKLSRNISHELKNPLTSIKGYAQLLEMKTQDAFALKAAGVMQEQIACLEKKLDDMYTIFRIQKSQESPCSLTKVISRTAAAAPQAGKITLALPDSECRIQADRTLLERLFTLYFAALNRDYYQDTVISLSTYVHTDNIEISVCYTGIYLPEDEVDTLFLPYSSKGLLESGLEYYEMLQLCSELDIDISVSNMDAGVTFVLHAPRTGA